MRFQARGLFAAVLVVAILGGVALFVAGLLAALAVAIPAAIVATLIFGKRVEGEG